MQFRGMQYRAIEPDKEVTVTLPALDLLTGATAILQAASDLVRGCTSPDTCTFCGPTGMELQRIGLTVLQAVGEAGDPILPAAPTNDNVRCPHGLHYNGAYCEECNP